uniref:HORMA domain-containing protein n=1 Tax=Steinernema glaseri TaxID=37863 RepID=A0A1I7ZP61_9BILA
MCAFLRDLCHSFLYKYSGYDEQSFHEETAMGDYTVMISHDEELARYIDTTLLSTSRWLQYQKLEGFAAVLVDDDENVAYSYQINFFKTEVKLKKRM